MNSCMRLPIIKCLSSARWEDFSTLSRLYTQNFSSSKRYTSENPMYNDLAQFNSTLPSFTADLTNSKVLKKIPIIAERYKENFQYNMSKGRRFRAMMMIYMYRELTSNRMHSEHDITKIYALGWCIEIMNSWAVTIDDVVDKSQFRRGQLSWYFKKNKQPSVIYDANLLSQSLYILFEKYWFQDEHYTACFETLNEALFRINVGQILDLQFTEDRNNKSPTVQDELDKYTFEAYNAIIVNKTSYYTFYLPMALAMITARKMKPSYVEMLMQLSLHMGCLFQAENDLLDVYGDPKRTGKEGTDIQDGRCSWLILKALELCTSEQKETLRLHYGKRDAYRAQAVKKVFDELDLKGKFKEYEADRHKQITSHIHQCQDASLQIIFNQILKSIFRGET